MPQVIVGTLVMEDGCHIDGSHESVISFDLRVIHFAEDKGGFGLNVEDSKIVFDADQGHLAIGDLPTLTEIADESVERLNSVTEDGWVWHVFEQSLCLTRVGEEHGTV